MADVNKEKNPWEMTKGERLEVTRSLKESGNRLFSEGKIKEAKEKYSTGLKRIIPLFNISNEDMEEVNSLKLALYLNIAACQIKLEQYEHAVKNCTKALEIDSKNIKALYRRCVALTEINDFQGAREDAERGLSMDENNQAIKKQLLKIERDWKEKTAGYEKRITNYFTEQRNVLPDRQSNEMTLEQKV